MKIMLTFLATVCAACAAYASEPLASVESPDLGPVPQAIRSVIEADLSFVSYKSLHCEMRGKTISLSSNRLISTWFLTTSGACGWGTALGPIWLVESRPTGEPSLILATGGYSLSVAGKVHDSFPGIAVISGTAEESVRKRYFFNGGKYTPGAK